MMMRSSGLVCGVVRTRLAPMSRASFFLRPFSSEESQEYPYDAKPPMYPSGDVGDLAVELWTKAHAKQSLEEVQKELKDIVTRKNESVAKVVEKLLAEANPKERMKVLQEGLGDQELYEVTYEFLENIAKADKVDLIEPVTTAYSDLLLWAQGFVIVNVTVPKSLSAGEQKELEAALRTKLDPAGDKPPVVRYSVDPSVLGGMIIRIKDSLLDLSVSSMMKKTLKSIQY